MASAANAAVLPPPSVIDAQDGLTIIAVLVAAVAVGVSLDRTRIGRWVPAPALVLVTTILLTNAAILPRQSPYYAALTATVVPLGVFLLLLRADVRRIFRETGALLRLYLIGAVGSVVGIVVALGLAPIGEGDKIAAVQAANLVGGTVNVMAVAHALELSATGFTAMMAAAAVAMNLYLVGMGAAHGAPVLQRLFARRANGSGPATDAPDPAAAKPLETGSPRAELTLLSLVWMAAAAAAAVSVSAWLGDILGRPELSIVFVSISSLLAANLAPRLVDRLAGDREIGTALLYLFIATLGVNVDVFQFGPEAGRIAIFIALAIGVHLVVMLAAGLVLRATLGEVIIASIAGIAGPSTAAAMAASLKERELVTPGILCGLLGFAGATFVGLALYGLL